MSSNAALMSSFASDFSVGASYKDLDDLHSFFASFSLGQYSPEVSRLVYDEYFSPLVQIPFLREIPPFSRLLD